MKPLSLNQLEGMIKFQETTDEDKFVEIFGEWLGRHLWGKFSRQYNHNLLKFADCLDGDNFERLVDAINEMLGAQEHVMDMYKKNHAKAHAVKPTPDSLKALFAEHGNDLLNWPTRYRMWLVTDPEAGDYIGKHAPGMLSIVAEAVGQWHQMSLLGFAEMDGSEDLLPF